MRDGVRLSVDVLLPADASGDPAPGPFPVVLTFTPYNKQGNGFAFRSDYLITRGYAQVIVDVRGTGSSQGQWFSYGEEEQQDTVEVLDWVQEQAWYDPDAGIALHGNSYGAIMQLVTMARTQSPAIKAAFPVVPMADSYRDIAGQGGQTNVSFLPAWLLLVTATGVAPAAYSFDDPAAAAQVLVDHGQGALNFQTWAASDALSGGELSYDGSYYRLRSPLEWFDQPSDVAPGLDVATFIVGGWYDLFQRGQPLLYNALAQRFPGKTRLLMSPRYHVVTGREFLGETPPGVPGYDYSLDELELRWFDCHLLGDCAGLDADIAPVTYRRIGEAGYVSAPSWPPPGIEYREYFLSGPAGIGATAGQLGDTAPPDGTQGSLPWHPGTGACSRSVAQWTSLGHPPLCDEDNRLNDPLSLRYEIPLEQDLVLEGPMAARLLVSTGHGGDAFLSVRVESVAPNGKATQLSAGWGTVSMRELDPLRTERDPATGLIIRPYHRYTRDARQPPAAAGEVVELWVEIFPAAARIPAGHRLRVSIQPADVPHLAPDPQELAGLAGGTLSLHAGSALVLPVQGGAAAQTPAAPSGSDADHDLPYCFWGRPNDPDVVNLFYPDEGATYWAGRVALSNGEMTLHGRFPHARYMSFNIYDENLAPIDALADIDIQPDAGSDNPFHPGADRTAPRRNYSIRVRPGPVPEQREPNTLYLEMTGLGAPAAWMLYRVYVKDEGRDLTGDVGLPSGLWQMPDGRRIDLTARCTHDMATTPTGAGTDVSLISGLFNDGALTAPAALAAPAQNPLNWEKFFNLPHVQGAFYTHGTPAAEPVDTLLASEQGGYLSNRHNAYITALGHRGFGELLVITGRAPQAPETLAGQERMGAGQVRYWSICTNERHSQRWIDCRHNEQIRLDTNGRYRIVVSAQEHRPTELCGADWLNWGTSPEVTMILRHMLPDPNFAEAIQRVATPADIGQMGDYLPQGRHMSAATFEQEFCP